MQSLETDGGAHPAPPDAPPLEQRIAGLAALPIGGLREAWSEAWGVPPPKGARRRLLMLGLAWKWQADVHGGLSRRLERRLAALEAGFRRRGAVDVVGGKHAGAPSLLPGARLDQGVEEPAARGHRHRDRLSLAEPQLGVALGHRPGNHRQPSQRPGLLRPARRRCGMSRGRSSRKAIRCAIYTRKSTEEGLEQDFNSLDAQREACAAYILSQKHEGWTALSARYDDGGYSGGSMDRPALRQLLADIEAGKIDTVIVYKVDRLTRSLADFARIVAIFDAAGVSFVSITQAFNTTTSMGRLTLNVLLSFAQFEREVTAERIRDKIAASKARGMWMGGIVPIGYRAEGRSLVPVPEEAASGAADLRALPGAGFGQCAEGRA